MPFGGADFGKARPLRGLSCSVSAANRSDALSTVWNTRTQPQPGSTLALEHSDGPAAGYLQRSGGIRSPVSSLFSLWISTDEEEHTMNDEDETNGLAVGTSGSLPPQGYSPWTSLSHPRKALSPGVPTEAKLENFPSPRDARTAPL